MPSELVTNEKISFIAGKNFTYGGKKYKVGDEFPSENHQNIETLVRTRHLYPVVDDLNDAPRHWFKEVRTRDFVLEKLGLKERTVRPTSTTNIGDNPLFGQGEDVFKTEDHTVDEVMEFAQQHPDHIDEVIEAEKQGKDRTTLLAKLEKLKEAQGESEDADVPAPDERDLVAAPEQDSAEAAEESEDKE